MDDLAEIGDYPVDHAFRKEALWMLMDEIEVYQSRYGRRSIDDVDLPGLLRQLGIDPNRFGQREE